MVLDRAPVVLPIAAKYRIQMRHWHRLRLHRHGCLHWLRLDFDTSGHHFSEQIFFLALLQAECYQRLLFDHATIVHAGLHGPFRTSALSIQDYQHLPAGQMADEIAGIVGAGKWCTPPPEGETLETIRAWLQKLVAEGGKAFRLSACRPFNESARRGGDFQHEWSHALLEFHEFLFLHSEQRTCDLIYLTYE